MDGRIVIVSGACGTGKSSVARLLAERSARPRAVHLHTDDLYGYIRKGYIPPWADGSNAQNATVIAAAAATARCYALAGYEVFADGFIGPWYLDAWLALAREGIDVRYVVLRPDERTTVARAMSRPARPEFPLEAGDVAALWQATADLGAYEGHAVDTGGQDAGQSADVIAGLLRGDGLRVG